MDERWKRQLQRLDIKGQPTNGTIEREEDHLERCPVCEHLFDRRDLARVLDHLHGDAPPLTIGSVEEAAVDRDEMMPADIDATTMWVLNEDGRSVQMRLPPIPVEGLPEPLRIALDFDAEAIDDVIRHLTIVRAKMQPPPRG